MTSDRSDDHPLTASEAKARAQEHLREDTDRWRMITPLTSRLKALRIDRIEDSFAGSEEREWRNRR